MSQLEFHPEHTRALARDVHTAARATDLRQHFSAVPPDAIPASGPTSALGSALNAALTALERRSGMLADHLASVSADAEEFVAVAGGADDGLAQRWEAAL